MIVTAMRAIGRRERDSPGAIVRVRVRLPAGGRGRSGLHSSASGLGQAHYIAAIDREVEESPRARLGEVRVEELAPLRVLELYLASQKTPPERARVLLESSRGG